MKSYHVMALGDGEGSYATIEDAEEAAIVFRKLENWVGRQWLMIELEDGRFSFKPFGPAPALSIGDDGIVRAREGQRMAFTIMPAAEGRMAIMAEPDLGFCIDDTGRLVARPATEAEPASFEVVQFTELEARLQSMHNCCGSEDAHAPASADLSQPGRVTWNDPGHQAIVGWAKEIVEAHRDHIPGMGRACELFQNADFWRGVTTGLLEADNLLKPWYTGFVYSSHFYDPATGRNFLGQTDATALTEADRRFLQSVACVLGAGSVGLYEGGYYLGLALHYLTDLTQPMHASNFIAFQTGPFDWRHSQLEGLLDQQVKDFSKQYKVDPATVDPAVEFAPEQLGASTAELVRSVAIYSNTVFHSQLKPILDAIPVTWVADGFGNQWPAYPDREWLLKTQPLLPAIISNAQLMTARFLVRWGQAISAGTLLPFAAYGLKAGDRGTWTFSASGIDGSWRRGNYRGHGARVVAFSPTRLRIEGEFCSFWWNSGEVIPFIVDVSCDSETSQWSLYVQNGATVARRALQKPRVSGDSLLFAPVTHPDGVAQDALVIKPLAKNVSWYAGVQISITIEECVRYACFEDMDI